MLLAPLLIAMWLSGSALVWLILRPPLLVALLIGAILTPTDPVVSSSILSGALAVHGDVELTHLRQFGLTHLFQVARSWRAPSSLVDADRGLCHVV